MNAGQRLRKLGHRHAVESARVPPRGVHLRMGSAGVGVSAGTNLMKEFWPDLKGVFHKKK